MSHGKMLRHISSTARAAAAHQAAAAAAARGAMAVGVVGRDSSSICNNMLPVLVTYLVLRVPRITLASHLMLLLQ
jgi:hypothetical protein